ncbi:DUF1552 domain-containing protein [Prosthecobacter dejongeii]|uniref:DUF1552 domain-containing protein n=1 Tax=Prosthecobacter dejongeii TaxID=48465 RepID=A0A7W8DNL0_9BACT|nr:DUF1552 domain-containing protein [Prosthecobacter dejongeii]MBB5036422.1 hypothetical protein [Prosthecobacter dejongeii]
MSKILSRRTVLRGLGATVALPFLEAMQPRAARAAAAVKAPTRMGFLFMPNGVREDRWTPEGLGTDFKLSPILSPLEAHRKDITVLTGLGNRASLAGDGHYAKTANWLTGTPIAKTTGKDLHCGISVDQVLAKEKGYLTRFPSLELGTEPIMSGVDRNVNYTMLYGSHIAWRTPTSPIPAEINPRFVFDRLFREDAAQRQASAEENKSVLDLVLADAKSLRAKVGKEDQQRLDEYLESLRHIERRIDADIARVASGENLDPAAKEATARLDKRIAEAMTANPKDAGSRLRLDHTEHCRLMLDLMALSFQTDSTRTSTFMFGWAVSGKNFSFLPGVEGGHHQLSHHEGKADKLDAYEKINRWHIEQYSYLIDKLKSIKEGEGNLLDNSLILFGSSIRDGNKHDPRNLPLVLAGHGGGVKGGQHVVAAKDTPLCNLYTGMLNRAGVETPSFGDSSGILEV